MNKKERHRIYMQAYYHRPEQKQKCIDRITKRKELLKQWLQQHKSTLQCSCGESHPSCLDFHHRDKNTKETPRGGISQAIYNGWSISHLERELAKCNVQCPNCHRISHANDIPKNKGVKQRKEIPTEDELAIMSKRRRCYWKHQELYIQRKNQRMSETLIWYRELKTNIGCVCGEKRYQCLDFHHRDNSTKPTNSSGSSRDMNMAHLIYRNWSKERILAEIANCDVLCANCHRKLHFVEPLE